MTVTAEQIIERVNVETTDAEIVEHHPDLVTAKLDLYNDLVQLSMLPAGPTSQDSAGDEPWNPGPEPTQPQDAWPADRQTHLDRLHVAAARAGNRGHPPRRWPWRA